MINFFCCLHVYHPLTTTDLHQIKIEQPGDRRGSGHVERGLV